MNGFAGEVCFGGHRSPHGLDRLATALTSRGGPVGRWDAGPFGVVAEPIALRRVEDNALIVMAASARLDDRSSLVSALGVSSAEVRALSDPELVARAYIHWGPALADRVHGDWVCAVWDEAHQRLWLGRDAAGNTGLFYWHESDRLVFSTSLPALLAHPLVPVRPNERRIARQIAVVFDRDDPMSTVYTGIQTLPGGFAVSVDAGGAVVTRWWRPETLRERSEAHDDDHRAQFMEVYRQAVEDRMSTTGGRLGLTLSGGLDSGSVSALAASAAAQQHVHLYAYTSVPALAPAGAGAGRDGDEEALAGITAAHLGLTDRWRRVRCESSGIVASLHDIQRVHARPIHGASNYYWLSEILRHARRDDVGSILTGQGGNLTVSWAGAGGWRGNIRELRTWWRSIQQPPAGLEAPRISPINAAWAASLSLRYPRARPADQRALMVDARLGRLASASLGSLYMELGAAHAVAVRDPTRDRRVIECCWQLPDRMFRGRGLIRQSFRRLLPDAVLDSRRRGLQAADVGGRILEEHRELRGLLDELSRHSLACAWLDVALMRRVLDELADDVTPERNRRASTILVRGLDAGMFLRRF